MIQFEKKGEHIFMKINNYIKTLTKNNADFNEKYTQYSSCVQVALLTQKERMGCGWSQTELAKHAGVNKSNIQYIEAGNNITLGTLDKIAAGFDKHVKISFV